MQSITNLINQSDIMALISSHSATVSITFFLSIVAIVVTYKYIWAVPATNTVTPGNEVKTETNTPSTVTPGNIATTATVHQSPPIDPVSNNQPMKPMQPMQPATMTDISDMSTLNHMSGAEPGAYRSCSGSNSNSNSPPPLPGSLFNTANNVFAKSHPQPHIHQYQQRIPHSRDVCEEKVTIARHKQSTTTISYPGSKEPIIITKTSTEHIDIPKSLVDWNPYFHGLRFAVAEDQGKRKHMENSTYTPTAMESETPPSSKDTRRMSFSLFDGHRGDEAAKFCTEHLHQEVDRLLADSDDEDSIEASIRKAFHDTDAKWEKHALTNRCEAGAVGVYVYYAADATPKGKVCLYVANVGDCRAILCSGDVGKPVVLTVDHDPKNKNEQKRCGDAIDLHANTLSGQVSVTRAIGDFYAVKDDSDDIDIDDAVDGHGHGDADKDQSEKPRVTEREYRHEKLKMLSCDPHIVKHELSAEDEFVIIACDGLWDVMDNQNALAHCRRSLRRDGDVSKAAQKLITEAQKTAAQSTLSSPSQDRREEKEEKRTADNISVMVIGFANKGKDGNRGTIGPAMPSVGTGSALRRRRRSFRGFPARATST